MNHLDLAVSQTSNPTGSWNIYKIDVTNDGHEHRRRESGPVPRRLSAHRRRRERHLPHDELVSVGRQRLRGAQIYALSKAQLAAGAAIVTMQHIDTSGMVNATERRGPTQPGFTVWPAQSPGAARSTSSNGGTEYFLSSNAG